MINRFARYAPAIIAGSALSGFGFAIGRDVYRRTRRNWPIVVILACLVGVLFSAIWIFRNYRTLPESIFRRTGALLLLAASGAIHLTLTLAAVYLVEPSLIPVAVPAAVAAQMVLFAVGAVIGYGHRRKRRMAWDAEDHNAAFMEENGLEVVDGDDSGGMRLRDHAQGIGYRLMDRLSSAGELEFAALGKRNKRGYIHYDETGKYTEWSGLSDIR